MNLATSMFLEPLDIYKQNIVFQVNNSAIISLIDQKLKTYNTPLSHMRKLSHNAL